MRVHFGPETPPLSLTSGRVIAPVKPVAETAFVKHIRIKSALLSRFWGRPMYLGAYVLLPAGYATHPGAHYPLMVNHGHFPGEGISPGARPRPIRT